MSLQLRCWCLFIVGVGCSREMQQPTQAPATARHLNALTATQDTILTVNAPAMGDQAATSVALSADGTLAALGVPRDDFAQATLAGSVRIFSRVAGAWAETAALRAPAPSMGAQFGFSISLSADGSRLLVGAPFEDGTPGADVGAARVYLRGASGWSLEASLTAPDLAPADFFGGAIALSGDGTRAFVGAIGDEVPGGPVNCGTVRVFVRNASGWNLETVLTALGADSDDLFASSLATTPDGSVLIVGVRNDDTDAGSNAGSVRVFSRAGTMWTEEATLTAFDAMPSDQLGNAVSISADGLVALIAAISDDSDAGTNSGSVRPFARIGGVWLEQPTLLPDSASVPSFGVAVALRADGTRAIVGAPLGSSNDGVARVYTLETTGWVADTALTVTPRPPGALVGTAVALSANGDVMLVGMPNFDGAATNTGGAALFSLVGLATGFACTTASQCLTGVCADGFCCDRACGSGASCEGCSMARTGQANGTCSVVASGRVCRPSSGQCDPAEVCNGVSTVCPGNVLSPAGQLCRAPAGSCDAPESCTGTTGTCPPDVMRPAGLECQPSSGGPCDLPDLCDGLTSACRARFQDAGAVCDTRINGQCDQPDTCTGFSGACPPSYLSGVECRASVGACDRAEFCTGGSPECPPDAVVSGGIVCRASRNLMCNPMESCDGISGACPADQNMCVGDEVPMPIPMMCPEAPACPTPPPQAATGCLQIGPGLPELALAVMVLLRARR